MSKLIETIQQQREREKAEAANFGASVLEQANAQAVQDAENARLRAQIDALPPLEMPRPGQIRMVTDKELAQEVEQANFNATFNVQIGGDHYKKLGQYQPWQVAAACMTPAELRGYMKGTVLAYLMREGDKGSDLDIEKARHTIELWQAVRKDK